MSKHSVQSKSFLVFCGVAILLSACIQSSSTVTKVDVPYIKERSQTLAAKTSDNQREGYKAIALGKLGKSDQLQGSDPKAIALRLFRNTEPEAGKSEISVETNYPRAVAIVTQVGIGDDSIRSIRYRAEFLATSNTVPSDQVWTLVWAGSQFKCQPGRGHQDWSSKLCN